MANLNNRAKAANSYDAIVVGSGMSGGWAAKELTEKGLKTLVLERGRMVRHIKDYPTATMPPWETKFPRGRMPDAVMKAHYPKQERTGYALTEYTQHFFVKDDEHPYEETQRFDWIRGYHVGGRSLLWARQVYRHSDLDFEANGKQGVGADWPIRYADIAPWYDYVERYIGVSGQHEGLAQLPDGLFQPAMEMNCVELDLKKRSEAKFPDRRITIGRVAHITDPTPEQKALGRGRCQHRNMCSRGCPFGAFFSSNAVTLVSADRTGNMTLKPNSTVTSLIFDEAAGKATGVRVLDEASGQEVEYYAPIVFLCASAMNTAWIMLNSTSHRFPNGFGNDSDQVGRNIMDHHLGVGAAAEAPGYEEMYYSGRRPNGVYIPRFRNLGDAASQRTDYLRGFGYQGGAGRPNWDRYEPGLGAARKTALTQPGPWVVRLGGFGEMLPNPKNRMTLNHAVKDKNGLPTITFDVGIGDNERAMRKDMKTAAAEMLEAAGFKNVREQDGDYGPGLGIHEMGTARMGRDPKTSVLNAHNQVHACKNVFVTDGAAMASSSCVNPSLTYMALTARAAAFAVEAGKKGSSEMALSSNRRQALSGLGGLAALWAIPTVASAQAAQAVLTWTPRTLTPGQARTLEVVAELIVPATDTPGAREAGVPKSVDGWLVDYCPPAQAAAIKAGLDRIDADARSAYGAGFAALSPERQTAILARYDGPPRPGAQPVGRGDTETGLSNRLPPVQGAPFFPALKDLVTAGYFTSQVGATKAVRFDPVPGAYHGCVPLKQIGRAWAT